MATLSNNFISRVSLLYCYLNFKSNECMKYFFVISLMLSAFTVIGQSTQKPPLHGKNWMAITGKPLAATPVLQFSKRW